jgi:AsmA protein
MSAYDMEKSEERRWHMKKAIKWVLIFVCGLVALVIVALLVIPMFVDVQKYKPEIEKQVATATGRPFMIGGELRLSLFPWAGLAFSDLHLGNPQGFKEKDLLSVKSFDVQVKLLPLISKDIQVKRFVIEGPRIVLLKGKDGRANWEGIGKPSAKPPAKPSEEKKTQKAPAEGLPIKSLAVGEFAIRNGSLLYMDEVKGEKREIKDLTLELKDVSMDRPIQVLLSASMDGKALSMEGKVGPVGKEPGKGATPLDVTINAMKELRVGIKGQIMDVISHPRFDIALEVASFSPRKLMTAMGQAFPVLTTDPEALNLLALKSKVKGDLQTVALSDGSLDLDQSKITFSAGAKDFDKPDLTFVMKLDQIDVDRYLPPGGEKKPAGEKEKPAAQEKKKTDYAPLRKLVLDGEIRVGKMKVMGAQMQDMLVKVKAKNGVFDMDPVSLKAYQGSVTTKANLDVRADRPKTSVDLETKGVMVRPLLTDLLKKDFLEGTTSAKLALRMEGDEADMIKKTLNGNGELRFADGAIIGIDLPGMVRNLKGTFGAEKPAERPKTDFSELLAPFTIKDGLVNTPGTTMASPLIRVLAAGNADLVKETLDFRVEPKFVATLKGQEDGKDRAGLMVPVLVTGTFSSPHFAPDLKGMLEKGLKEKLPSSPSGLKDMLKGGGGATKEGAKPAEEKPKDMLKGLFKR